MTPFAADIFNAVLKSVDNPGAPLVREQVSSLVVPLQLEIFDNNFDKFDRLLESSNLSINRSHRSIWVAIAETLGRNKFASARFQLPLYHGPQLPPAQAVFLTDDGKSNMVAKLTGGHALAGYEIDASLHMYDERHGNRVTIPAEQVTISKDGGNVTATFPSAKKYKLVGAEAKERIFTSGAVLVLKLDHHHSWNKPNASGAAKRSYKNIYYAEGAKKKAQAAPKFKVTSNSRVIKSSKGVGAITLLFDLNKKAFDVEVTLSGADIAGAYKGDNPANEVRITNGKLKVGSTGAVTIMMRNLDPSYGASFMLDAKQNGKFAKSFEVREG